MHTHNSYHALLQGPIFHTQNLSVQWLPACGGPTNNLAQAPLQQRMVGDKFLHPAAAERGGVPHLLQLAFVPVSFPGQTYFTRPLRREKYDLRDRCR
jgi:hypothetical protein